MRRISIVCVLGVFLSGCAVLDADMVKELAKDNASFCARFVASVSLKGSGELAFCRSNHDGAKVTLGADGSLSIEHK